MHRRHFEVMAPVHKTPKFGIGSVARSWTANWGKSSLAPNFLILFGRFQIDAKTIYPRVEEQIRRLAGTLNLQSPLNGLRA
jgi:hypothetical protein